MQAMTIIDRRKNLRALITLAIPVILEQIMTTLLQYVDSAMVGRLGAQATASVNLTTSVNWLIGNCFSAVGIAAVAIIAAAYGAGDFQKIKTISTQVVNYIIIVGLLVGSLAVSLSPFIPVWMNADSEIQEQAASYFRIISFPLLFRAASVISASDLRAVKDTKTPMLVNLAANILNVVLNAILIYPAGLGVRGAAIATSISTTLSGSAMLIVMLHHPLLKTQIRPLYIDKEITKQVASIGLPAFATSAVSCMGHIVFAALVSSQGTVVFAAHSIALSAESLFYLPGYGLRSATSTLIGIAVGENNYEKFKVVQRQSIILTILMMTLTGTALFLLARPIMAIFTPDLQVIALGARVLKLIALSEPLFGLMIVCEGIYYGLGQTRTTFIVTTIGSWGIRILFTLICVRVLHTSLLQIWMCMFADNTFRALAMAIPLLSGRGRCYFETRRKSLNL